MSILGACQIAAGASVDARLSEGDTDSLQRVQLAMQGELGLARIILARDAFTRNSLLTLEHRIPAGIDEPATDARATGLPEQFRLQMRDGRCTLLRERTGTLIPLADVMCQPVPTEARD